MEENKLLSEEKYQKNSKGLKTIGRTVLIIGIITLVIGILLLIVGVISFGTSAINLMDSDIKTQAGKALGGFGIFALGGFLDSIGFGMTAIGGIILFIAHRREIAAFTTQQVMPVAEEGIEKITPTVSNAAGEIAKGISKGIAEGKKAAETETTNEE